MNVLLAHPTGNNFVREAAIGLQDASLLKELHLSIAACGNNAVAKISKLPGFSELARRTYPAELAPVLHLHPWREAVRLIASRMHWVSLLRHEFGWASVDACYQHFDRQVSNRLKQNDKISCVYAYEDGALETFRVAQKRDLRRVYDLPIAHWQASRRIMEEEAERLPNWRPTLSGVQDSKDKYLRKEEELSLAECIVCPSTFVADSIPEEIRKGKQVRVIPFGSPTGIIPHTSTKSENDKLRVLFAGSMSQRKGLGDLMTAMSLLDSAQFELHVMGSPLAPMEFYHQAYPNFIHYSPRPHDQVLALMKTCDVLVLPSLVEGRALVQQEALACGLPIIVTANAGAPDLVEDGQAGFLVPIRSPESIADKLLLLKQHPERLKAMKTAAPIKAATVSWKSYRQGIVDAVLSL
ncbi:glycosyltransferase [Cerasicoccus arenae]|uniref:Glycosyl transferase family 1 domain-containing protein n=1 Tax=Cerasicoccus arenae TaxID=424488 RepID=A0A8J3D9Z6_9BACT|nr:glycosyltransferase [Cerasicoccus arenae]MBK1857485.1 glycosyltransferase [Cerasicoccus arenae]GHB95300.1 hypothetical protein GCM10007047_08750 [Cerasicoccus arenae]